MKHSDLECLLVAFKQGREQLIWDFKNEDIEIYDAMFRYETDEKLMYLSIDKYFMSWIDSHFNIFDRLTENNVDEVLIKEFIKQMLLFIQKSELTIKASEIERGNQLFFELLLEKRQLLQQLLDIAIKADNSYNKLIYIHQRDKTLFNRKLSELTGEI